MSRGEYFILRKCKNTIEALENAVWDTKSGIDMRLDDGEVNVDSLDALEYATENYFNDIL